MPWVGDYFSPVKPEMNGSARVIPDEELMAAIVGMLCGPNWDIEYVDEQTIVMRQRPPYQAWRWTFHRVSDA